MNAQTEKTEEQEAREREAAGRWAGFFFWLLVVFPPLILIEEDVTAPFFVAGGVLYIAWLAFVGLVAAVVGLLRG